MYLLHAGPIFNNLQCCHTECCTLPWYWWTVIHVNQSIGTHLLLQKHMDCAKLLPQNGRLVTTSSNIILAVHKLWAHIKSLLLINLEWPLTPDNQNSSLTMESIIKSRVQSTIHGPESRVQVLYCPWCNTPQGLYLYPQIQLSNKIKRHTWT